MVIIYGSFGKSLYITAKLTQFAICVSARERACADPIERRDADITAEESDRFKGKEDYRMSRIQKRPCRPCILAGNKFKYALDKYTHGEIRIIPMSVKCTHVLQSNFLLSILSIDVFIDSKPPSF
jgi:hypothetical protein